MFRIFSALPYRPDTYGRSVSNCTTILCSNLRFAVHASVTLRSAPSMENV